MSEDEVPSFVGVTPFGPYCIVCNESLALQAGILSHGREFHPECDFKNATVVREVQRRMLTLRSEHAHDLSSFLTHQSTTEPIWFCTVCYRSFSKGSNYHRHLERNKECLGHLGGKIDCYVTICGRLGPKSCTTIMSNTSTSTIVSKGSTVSTLTDSFFKSSINMALVVESSSKVPTTLLTTHEQARQILEPFVRSDENAHDLALIYYPLLAPGFEGKMKEFVSYSNSQAGEDGILFKWLEAGREWLENYAAGHIANVSANVRSRLAEFEQREVDGSSVGTRTFTLRRGISRLISELHAALRFFFRYPTTIFDSFKSPDILNMTKRSMIESAIIPKILFTAAAEEPDDHGKLPVACLYCLSRGFTSKGGIDLVMTECGWFGSRISAVLHLLRAGVCGYLITLTVTKSSGLLSEQEMDIVNRIQNGRVTNLLAPYVKRLRDMSAKKPPTKANTVNANGDITSGSFTFAYITWSTIIPRLEEIARACFVELFEGDQWKLFMEKPLSMSDWVLLEASVAGGDDGSTIWLHDITVKKNLEPILGRIQSVMELCFFGLGVGAVRHEEVIRLTALSCQWHNSYLYYWTESLKKGSLKASSTPKLVEHRLSLSLSRIVLLGRHAMVVSSDIGTTESLFPASATNSSMLGLVQEIFDLDCPPQMLNVRHLFTSIGNVIMPESGQRGNEGCLVSSQLMTEKSGHTQGTGRRAYGTWLENSEEALYDLYHGKLGESNLDPPPLLFTPFSDSVLKASLETMLGRDATYRSESQKNMICIAANSISRHAFVGLPCGQGKSLSWMVPSLASYLAGRHVGLRIVVLPYKFLLGHVVQHALTLLGLLRKRLIVSFLDSSQIHPDTLPPELEGGEIPNLLFLNLDGAATLFRYHLTHLQNLASRNILKRVYLDELQQILVEYAFRSSYQSFRQIGRLGVPVMCLSGSLPCSMAMSLMRYCGLSLPHTDEQSVDIVEPTDPIGDGFSFHVTIMDDISAAVVDYVLKYRVGACHVLCSSIALVETISTCLSSRLKVLSITGDSPYQDQVACAKRWYKGGHDVLVSTVVALVGNENKLCKTIVVAGFLFNVSSLVQAIGRLRPEQRGPTSQVQIFRFPIRSACRRSAKETGELLFSEIVDAECLTMDSRDLFLRLFTPVGLQEVLTLQEGCYLQHLSRLYGFVRLPCDRCGLCRPEKNIPPLPLSVVSKKDWLVPGKISSSFAASSKNTSTLPLSTLSKSDRLLPMNVFSSNSTQSSFPKRILSAESSIQSTSTKRSCTTTDNVLANKQASDDDERVRRVLFRKAQWVFLELQYRCIACGKSICNGECGSGCFRCGDRSHNSSVCSYNVIRLGKILANKGVCFGCFDTRQHLMKEHDMKKCPLKRRLKRLVFLYHQKDGKKFDDYLRTLYSSEMSFVRMVASFSDQTSLGR